MRIFLLLLFITICPLYGANHEGIPFFVNYPSAIYQAHNRNFDVTCDRNGHVYIANFEGILHYDYNCWEVLYTPGFSRITRLFTDSQGRIWAGGYNVFSRIVHDSRGCLALKTIVSDTDKVSLGELDDILEIEGDIYVRTTVGDYYVVENDSALLPAKRLPEQLLKLLSRNELTAGVNQLLVLVNGWTARATGNEGLVVRDQTGIELFTLTERNGLCSNSVSRIATDRKGNLWGTTDNGVFCVFLPSAFGRYTSQEGVKGEVISMTRYKERLFVGTLQGLYVLENNTFVQVKGIRQACWMLRISSDNQLYAATSGGVFHVRDSKKAEKILDTSAFSIAFAGTDAMLLGAMDGIYRYYIPKRKQEKIAEIEKVMHLAERDGHAIEARTLYGESYVQAEPDSPFVKQPREEREAMTVYTDKEGYRWQTDLKGKNLQVIHPLHDTPWQNRYLKALRNYVIRVIFIEEQQAAWFGGDFGLVRFDLHETDFTKPRTPQTFLREISLNHDSIFRGGFYVPDGQMPRLGSEIRNIRFSFATDANCFTGTNMYRCKLEGYDADWSTWSPVNQKDYANLFPGKYTFQIQSKDIYDNESEVENLVFTLLPPFYLKWYSILGYLLAFAGSMYLLFRWRMRKLLREKERLEEIVNQRTRQLVEQKDEIEEKSRRLETALDELGQAQDSLVRQEKMATVGKLTQGLIDRILNPLNYINNFSHLTTGLVHDLRQSLEEGKEQLDEDIYLDSLDVIEMMASNLEKIEEHGANTTRILKAMEEILKNHGSRLDKLELTGLCGKCVDQLNAFYAKEIEAMHISVNLRMPEEPLYINGNTEQLSKALMSLLNNGMYAVIKKYKKAAYEAEVSIRLEKDEGTNLLRIILRDNGIGIEATILDKIFDPFFTTKTTGEAAGIGLYLGKEVLLNHKGQITVTSQKDEYTEFTITLPVFG